MSERLKRIVEELRLRPDDAVLEIGCGHGVAADYICERLQSGRLLAIDRSPTMIAAARRRNRAHIADGKAQFQVADALEFEPGRRKFDKILAVRVGLFHRDAAAARARVERWLAPDGRLLIVYDEPK